MDDSTETIQIKLKNYFGDRTNIEYWELIISLTNIYGKNDQDNNGECFFDNGKYILITYLDQILLNLLNDLGYKYLFDVLEQDEDEKIIDWHYSTIHGEGKLTLI